MTNFLGMTLATNSSFKSKYTFLHLTFYSEKAAKSNTIFQGQIGVSNEDRYRVRKIKLDDLRATLEKQMTDKYITKEVSKQDNLSTGQATIMEDLKTDHMVRKRQPLYYLIYS